MSAARHSGRAPEIDGGAGAAPKSTSFLSGNVMKSGSAAASGQARIPDLPHESGMCSFAFTHPALHLCFDRVIQTSGYPASGHHALTPESERHVTL
jgi:hypothetical protein